MAYNLGIKPDRLKVDLYRDADFDSVLTRRDEAGGLASWGVDATLIRLRFPTVIDPALVDPQHNPAGHLEWAATLEPARDQDGDPILIGTDPLNAHARFQVDKVETNKRSNGEKVELWVADQCWAAGTISKKGVV